MLRSTLEQIEQRIRETEARIRQQDARTVATWQQLRAAGRQRLRTALVGAATTLAGGWLLGRLGRRRRTAAGAGPRRRRRARHGLLRPLLTPVLLPLVTSFVAPLVGRKGGAFLAGFGLPFPVVEPPELSVVPVDLQRYAGLWFEVARLPNRYQDECASDVQALYELQPEGGLRVVNRCVRSDGTLQQAEAVGRPAAGMPPGWLEVCFAPAWLHWWPGVWADYCVMAVAPDYSSALVGTPERDALWILSRTPQLADEVYAGYVEKARGQGFPVEKLVRTAHTAPDEGAAMPRVPAQAAAAAAQATALH